MSERLLHPLKHRQPGRDPTKVISHSQISNGTGARSCVDHLTVEEEEEEEGWGWGSSL